MNNIKEKITISTEDSYFHFSQISNYLKKYTAPEFLKLFVFGENSVIDENLEIIAIDGTTVCVGKDIPSFTLDWIHEEHYENMTWELLENFIYPVYYEKESDEIIAYDFNQNLWKTRFIEDYETLNTYSISNKTDFNEKFGWYPHLKIEDSYIPLYFVGELLINSCKAYLFLDFNYSSEFFEGKNYYRLDTDSIGLDFDDIYAVIWEDTLELDNKFVKHSLSNFDKTTISFSTDEEDNMNKRFIPYDPIFNFAPLVQDYYGPEIQELISGKWKFLYQIPVPWYGAHRINDSELYYIDEGDSGSIAIFLNQNNEFCVKYSQT